MLWLTRAGRVVGGVGCGGGTCLDERAGRVWIGGMEEDDDAGGGAVGWGAMGWLGASTKQVTGLGLGWAGLG